MNITTNAIVLENHKFLWDQKKITAVSEYYLSVVIDNNDVWSGHIASNTCSQFLLVFLHPSFSPIIRRDTYKTQIRRERNLIFFPPPTAQVAHITNYASLFIPKIKSAKI